jgi:tetratricopeptide (TPR) repeat protein
MSADTTLSPAADAEASDTFKRLTAIMIATVTILAALAAFLQTDAGGKATRANRDAQAYAIEALGARASGQAEVDYGWYGAAHSWYALDTLAKSADRRDDPDAAARYRSVRDEMISLSPLMQPPYFDPESGLYPDQYSYQADVFLVRATELSERYTVAAQLNNGWNAKANTYIVHLTLLAVALALYGLSTTPDNWTRWVFVAAGSLLVFATVVWMSITLVTPVTVNPEAAITAYAEGYGHSWRGDNDKAITSLSEAISLAPEYANAYYERGSAHFNLASANLGLDPQAAQEELRLAANDFEQARKAGKDDGSVNWNLGWTYYLLGFYGESADASRRALAADPNLFAVRCNLGLTLLADGNVEAARSEYAEAVRGVTQRVSEARDANREPPSSLWGYLDACAIDVDNLNRRLDDQARFWTQAPPRELIADTPEVRGEMQRLISEFKSTLVALEYTKDLPGERPNPNVSAFRFVSHRQDENDNYQYDSEGFAIYDPVEDGRFANGVKKISIEFDYQEIKKGQKETWKIYRNGVEDPSLRVTAEWGLNDSGIAVKDISYAYSSVFVLRSGEYTIELYIDNYLVQRGTCMIETGE